MHRSGTSSAPPPPPCLGIPASPQCAQRHPPPWLLGVAHARGGRGTGGVPRRALLINPETRYELHTTRTQEFLGLDRADALFPQSGTTSDVVVGVLDTSVWPERAGYDDVGLGPCRRAGRGSARKAATSTPPRATGSSLAQVLPDRVRGIQGPNGQVQGVALAEGQRLHVTHTSSTAAGSAVRGADLLGLSKTSSARLW
nr:subtilisin-like protease SBT1.7 [Aegilops tauschii subsp. strangulata]